MTKIFWHLGRIFARLGGYKITSSEEKIFKDMDLGFRPVYELCAPYSMTSLERMYALYKAVLYVIQAKIPGDFVECGVWKGGSAMIIAETLKALGVTDRNIYLYDTFEGMPEPDERDIKIRTGATGKSMWLGNQNSGGWCNISIEEVTENVLKTGYPKERFIFVKGKVEDTIPTTMPNAIAILRLDTDWYASTIHEFNNLYPLLSESGVLMIDDYGSWSGSRDATDQYFKEHTISMYLHRVDMARVGIKSNT